MARSTETSDHVPGEPRPASDAPARMMVQRRIEWSDTDASGRWHNTAAFRMIEFAETAMLERLGILEEIYGRLPRVHISADFKRLLNFRDIVDIVIEVAALGNTSVTYDFEIRRDGEVCVQGRAVAVLISAEGEVTSWSERHRRVLLSGGEQRPELLRAG